MEQDRLGKLVSSSPITAPIDLIRETLPPTLIQVGEAELLVRSADPFTLNRAAYTYQCTAIFRM